VLPKLSKLVQEWGWHSGRREERRKRKDEREMEGGKEENRPTFLSVPTPLAAVHTQRDWLELYNVDNRHSK